MTHDVHFHLHSLGVPERNLGWVPGINSPAPHHALPCWSWRPASALSLSPCGHGCLPSPPVLAPGFCELAGTTGCQRCTWLGVMGLCSLAPQSRARPSWSWAWHGRVAGHGWQGGLDPPSVVGLMAKVPTSRPPFIDTGTRIFGHKGPVPLSGIKPQWQGLPFKEEHPTPPHPNSSDLANHFQRSSASRAGFGALPPTKRLPDQNMPWIIPQRESGEGPLGLSAYFSTEPSLGSLKTWGTHSSRTCNRSLT